MSTTKRARQRQPEQPLTSSTLPPAKRAKLAKDNQQSPSALAFLTDERQRAGKVISAKVTNGTDTGRLTRADESRATISGQDAANDNDNDNDDDEKLSTSSDEPSSSSEDDVDMTNGDAHQDTSSSLVPAKQKTNGISETEEEQDENAAPSFGELLQTAHPDIIDVNATLDGPDALVKAHTSDSKVLQAPSATSLATVLSQALRTNDKDLLESCLQTKDTAIIKSTIQRLQSPLIADLMQKLAERLHKRPGRAGPLMVWVQWSLVAHGGYLAGQPQVVRRLKALRQVVKDRAGSLPSLITLKGKLDLLGAQVELRRSIRAHNDDLDESDESDDDVVYVEGDDVQSSSDEEDEEDLKLIQQTPRANGSRKPKSKALQQDSDEEMDGDIPLINGIDEDAEMESLADDEDGEAPTNGGFIDDEADESDGDESIDSEEQDSESASEVDEDDNDDSSSEDEVAVVPQKSRPVRRAALLKKR